MQKFLSFLLSPKFIGILIGLAVLYAILPVILPFIGVRLVELLGCDTGGPGPQTACPDLVETILTYMILTYWFGIFTLPTGFLVAGVLVIILVLRLVMLKQRD
ncbi:hypothetical protein [Oscillatoria sp. HE19RPO]|uniref:hypothetical protein n=1 Tax=Oscillatoria sp. HE19RPO TaxID=2954806 RepID=UPI0020C257EB|nr:hypothetical protein [Oscillatoria sp. HE19RPO]